MISVLLVDNSRAARTGLVNSLRKRPSLDVIGAVANESEAARSLACKEPDLVLIDIHYRDGDGAALCAEIRRLTNAPIVVLTSFMTVERWDRLKAAGADAHLLKRVDSDALERDLVSFAKADRGRNSSPARKRNEQGGQGIW